MITHFYADNFFYSSDGDDCVMFIWKIFMYICAYDTTFEARMTDPNVYALCMYFLFALLPLFILGSCDGRTRARPPAQATQLHRHRGPPHLVRVCAAISNDFLSPN